MSADGLAGAPAAGLALREDAAYARDIIANGSKSFAAASRLLPVAVRNDVARLYAWCRVADDVIDGQDMGHGAARVADPAARLERLTARTAHALAGQHQGDPVFDGFGAVANRHGISERLTQDVLDGFAMDVRARRYESADDLFAYCYGVAGAVGVMMALVIGVDRGDADTLDRACDLGLAFQLTNIARDVIADAEVGRVYLPAEWLANEGLAATVEAVRAPHNRASVYRVAARLLAEAERYYASAEVGVRRLPFRVAWAIASAGRIYRAIGVRRLRAGPDGLHRRVGTGTGTKLALISAAAAAAARRSEAGLVLHRTGLWQRPPRP